MEDLAHILVPLAGCAMIFGVVYVVITADNRQKMAMIEAGMNPHPQKKHSKLRTAMLAIFIPIGILIGQASSSVFNMQPETASVTFGFLFAGIGLLATYIVESKREKNETDLD